MFWKKKERIEVKLDSRHSDNRAAYRIAPDEELPVILKIGGEEFKAQNISGTGVAFRCERLEQGSRSAAMVRVPTDTRIFPVVIEVVAKQDDLCRCRFKDINEQAENLLHAYILELQKRKIRQNHAHD